MCPLDDKKAAKRTFLNLGDPVAEKRSKVTPLFFRGEGGGHSEDNNGREHLLINCAAAQSVTDHSEDLSLLGPRMSRNCYSSVAERCGLLI